MDVSSEPIRFALIGTGWRAEFYLRIAQVLPQRFQVTAALVRDPSKHAAFESRWNIPAFGLLKEVLASSPSFVVLSVPREVAPD